LTLKILHITYKIPEVTSNIHTPGSPTLLVCATLIMLGDSDPVTPTKVMPSPVLIPAAASVPPNPYLPPELSPVVHSILPSAYRNITNDSTPLVASTHWNVLICIDQRYSINYNILYCMEGNFDSW